MGAPPGEAAINPASQVAPAAATPEPAAARPDPAAASPGAPVLVISHDVVGPAMAGPGIRYYHLARVLAQHFPVVLAFPAASGAGLPAPFPTLPYADAAGPELALAARRARCVLVPALLWAAVPELARGAVPVVIDCYDPYSAETLHLHPEAAAAQQALLAPAYLAGDFFIGASERQRDWLLGILEAYGRINPATYAADPALRRLVDVVPYGIPETPPRLTRAVLRAAWPAIGENDRVVLWGGGLWPWLDPLTAIRAVAALRDLRPAVRLVFPGARHPNPGMAGVPTLEPAARALAEELGVLNQHVFFGDWVPVADWPNVLLESALALALHRQETLESRLAFRSRVLDYIWAGLPVVATEGDATSDIIRERGLGAVVAGGDVGAVSAAIQSLLAVPRAEWAARFEPARQALTWQQAARPLVSFCQAPAPAADRTAGQSPPGNRYYSARLSALEARLAVYEQMRFVRLVRWLHPYRMRLRRRLGSRA